MYWKDALKTGKIGEQIDFNNERIGVGDALKLQKIGVIVPEELIEYPPDEELEDESIFPIINEDNFSSGKIAYAKPYTILLSKKQSDYIKMKNIDIQHFVELSINKLISGAAVL